MSDVVDKAIEVLNRALEKDPIAIRQLFRSQVSCNDDLADDPDIQVRQKDKQCFLRPLGLINGLFGAAEDGFGKIVVIVDKVGNAQKFVKYDPKVHNFDKK